MTGSPDFTPAGQILTAQFFAKPQAKIIGAENIEHHVAMQIHSHLSIRYYDGAAGISDSERITPLTRPGHADCIWG
jgi:hypothetical protein